MDGGTSEVSIYMQASQNMSTPFVTEISITSLLHKSYAQLYAQKVDTC